MFLSHLMGKSMKISEDRLKSKSFLEHKIRQRNASFFIV